MPIYKAPFRDQQFVMHEVLGAVDMLRPLSRYAELDADTLNQVIEEAGKFCEELLFPVNQSGDAEGCTYDVASRSVKTPRGFKERVTVTRKIQGMPTRLTLPLRKPVRPGDTITVTERWF